MEIISALISFTKNIYLYLVLIAALFFIIQEGLIYLKTKKIYHKIFSLGFSFIFISAVFLILSQSIFKFRSAAYFVSGISGILCFLIAFYFVLKATKTKNQEEFQNKNKKKFISVYTTNSQSKLALIKSLLDTNKIIYLIDNENAASTGDSIPYMEVMVSEDDAPFVRNLLKNV